MKTYHDITGQKNTKVLALSTDSIDQSQAFKNEMELPFSLLCDVERTVVSQYHLLNPHEHGGIAYPAIFLIKPSGEIGYRSLDRTAQRVDLTEILDYLAALETDPGHTLNSTASKPMIIPNPSTLLQIGRNLIMRGSWSDWKHYLLYPFFMARYLLGIAKRADDQK